MKGLQIFFELRFTPLIFIMNALCEDALQEPVASEHIPDNASTKETKIERKRDSRGDGGTHECEFIDFVWIANRIGSGNDCAKIMADKNDVLEMKVFNIGAELGDIGVHIIRAILGFL